MTAAFWVLFHRCRRAISQIFLEGGIGNDRDAECKYDRAGLFPPIRIPSIIYSTPLDRHIPYLVSRLPPVPDKPVDRYRQSAIAIGMWGACGYRRANMYEGSIRSLWTPDGVI